MRKWTIGTMVAVAGLLIGIGAQQGLAGQSLSQGARTQVVTPDAGIDVSGVHPAGPDQTGSLELASAQAGFKGHGIQGWTDAQFQSATVHPSLLDAQGKALGPPGLELEYLVHGHSVQLAESHSTGASGPLTLAVKPGGSPAHTETIAGNQYLVLRIQGQIRLLAWRTPDGTDVYLWTSGLDDATLTSLLVHIA